MTDANPNLVQIITRFTAAMPGRSDGAILAAVDKFLRPTRVYLAGPINGCTDQHAKAWRETVKGGLSGRGIEFIDPMDRDYRGHESENVAAIVERDKADIDRCKIVLAYCWQPSFGTAMEIHHAYSIGVEVWAVVEGKTPSPWLAYHARIFTSLGDAVLALADLTRA